MARYTKESLDTLRSKIDLAEVLGAHIELKRAGATLKALCPFHDEKTPSFVVGRGDSHYHCYGCGAHGDAIAFLMQHQKMAFSDAVDFLAERFSVELVREGGEFSEKKIGRGRLKEVLERAAAFYHYYLLHTEEGRAPLEYLSNRGYSHAFLSAFRIGWAPCGDNIFLSYMLKEGASEEELEACGLLAMRGGRLREFFSERIMFPIQDAQGSIIGFSARKIKETTYGGKYINTQETDLFKKSHVLFGMHQSRRRITKEGQAIIVEGQLDALRLIYNGFDYTVAALGTAFGQAHVEELIKLGVERVFLLFDGDDAGRAATLKVGQLFQKEGVEVSCASIEKGQDPDLILLQEGPPGIAKRLFEAKEYLFFLYSFLARGKNLQEPAEKNLVVSECIARIREWNNPVHIHESCKRLAHMAGVPEELVGISPRTFSAASFRRKEDLARDGIDPDKILEQDFLRWLILFGSSEKELFDIARTHLPPDALRNPVAGKIYNQMLISFAEGQAFDLFTFAADATDPVLSAFLTEILSRKVNREKAKPLLLETIEKILQRNWMLECEELLQKIQSGLLPEEEVKKVISRFDSLKRSRPEVPRG
jgi:DNA primase